MSQKKKEKRDEVAEQWNSRKYQEKAIVNGNKALLETRNIYVSLSRRFILRQSKVKWIC